MIRQAFLTLGVLAVVGILAPWSLTQLRTRHALEDWNAWVALLTYAGCVALLIRLRVTVWGRRRDRRMRHRARWIAVIVLAAAAGASLRVADFYSTYGTSWNWGREGGPSCTRIVLKRWGLIVEHTAVLSEPPRESVDPALLHEWGGFRARYLSYPIEPHPAPGHTSEQGSGGRADWEIFVPVSAVATALLLFPILVLWRGAWRDWRTWRRWRRWYRLHGGVGGFCRVCRYNLTGNISGVCPECGARIRKR